MGIRTCLAVFAIALVSPLLVLSAWHLHGDREAEHAATIERALEHARDLAQGIDREIAAAQSLLRALAASPPVERGDLEAIRRQAGAARMPEGASLRLACAADLVAPGGEAGVQATWTATAAGARPDAHREDGALGGSATASTAAVNAGQTIDIATAIGYADDRCRLVMSLDPQVLRRAAGARRLPPSWRIVVLNQDLAPLAIHPAQHPWSMAPGLRAALAGPVEGHLRNRDADGAERYEAYAKAARTGWVVTVGVPAAESATRHARSLPVVWAGVLVTATLACTLIAVLARRLRRAIADLGASVAALVATEKPAAREPAPLREMDALRKALEEAHAALAQERQARAGAEEDTRSALGTERAARENAERQMRAKDEFIAMLGHELRNPLSAMNGALAVLKRTAPSDETDGAAREVIARQARRLTEIADELLALGRFATTHTRLVFDRVELAALCRDAIAGLEQTGAIARGRVSLTGAEAVWVRADRGRLEQAIGILIAAAAKPDQPRASRLEALVDREYGKARVVVREAGPPGIPEHLRTGSPSPTPAPGTPPDQLPRPPSVATIIAERLVQMHGGSLDTPVPGGSSQAPAYVVHLPIAEEESATPLPASVAPPGLRVLLVDDHEDSRTMLRMLLQQVGHETVEAVDGIEGVQLALCARPELAIVDIGLPGIDGYEVARRLRKLPHGGDMTLIALTGYGQAEDKERALRAGFDLHLVKPVDEDKLADALERAARPAGGAP